MELTSTDLPHTQDREDEFSGEVSLVTFDLKVCTFNAILADNEVAKNHEHDHITTSRHDTSTHFDFETSIIHFLFQSLFIVSTGYTRQLERGTQRAA